MYLFIGESGFNKIIIFYLFVKNLISFWICFISLLVEFFLGGRVCFRKLLLVVDLYNKKVKIVNNFIIMCWINGCCVLFWIEGF